MTENELKLRRLAGQHLLRPAGVQRVLRDLCGVQAQFLSHAFHALSIRSDDFSPEETDGMMKNWTLRGTMHLFSAADLPLMLYQGRTHALRPCDTLDGDEYISAQRKRYFAERIVCAIGEGMHEREALKRGCEEAGMSEEEARSVFDPWGGTIRALCEAGVMTHVVSEKKAYVRCIPFEAIEREPARIELMRRYVTHYGPITVRDAAYFFRFTQAECRRMIECLPAKTAEFGEKTYYYIEETPFSQEALPACIFLSGFDPLLIGYEKKENPFLPPEHLRGIFSLSGIVMPAVLLYGRVVGRWKRVGKRLAITLFETVSADRLKIMEEQAMRTFRTTLRIEVTIQKRLDKKA